MYASLKSEDIVCFMYITQIMQFSFWQVYYCSSAISFFDGFRSLPCFSATSKRRTAVGLLLRLFREIFAVHRYRTATHSGCSPQLFCLVIMHGACELYLSTHFTVGCDDSSHRTPYVTHLRLAQPQGRTMCAREHVRYGVAWEHNVLPYDITCANRSMRCAESSHPTIYVI